MRRRILHFVFWLLFGFNSLTAATSSVYITEFMADNESVLRDEDGDYSDWIEIYNPGATPVNLDGWSLTDDVERPAKWRFPAGVQVPAEGYLVVFASDKNRAIGTLHTNFRLSAEGEYLGLIDPLGRAASEFALAYPEQNADISYGRDAADFDLIHYFPVATPGAPNVSGGPGFGSEVHFSRLSGTFSAGEGFLLELTSLSANAVIYYSFGTNVPGTAAHQYTAPIPITNSTIVRARAIEPGLIPGPVSSHSYIALAPDVQSFSSDLPIMILHNFGQGAVLASGEDQHVVMQSFEPRLSLQAQDHRSALHLPPAQAERGIFHVRGFLTAVTSTNGKSSFLLETQDELGMNRAVPLLGLPEESDWVLYAPNAWDRALFQNPLAHQLLRDIGTYSSRTRFFELFLKDDAGEPGAITMADYYGLFVLEEKVKRDKNRVVIDQLQPEHTNLPEITGGYLLALDETNEAPRLSAGGVHLNWEYPSGFEMTNLTRAPQLSYITTYLNDFNNALQGPNWTEPVAGYRPYIDLDSWINYHLHTVLVFSPDTLRLSTFLYKPRNEPLKFGPGWDYDRSQGSDDGRDFNPLVWRSIRGADYFNEPPWWSRLFQDPDFWQQWIDRYQELRGGPLSNPHIFALIDQFANEVREAQFREQSRWNVFPRTGPTSANGYFYNFGPFAAYQNEVNFKKHWYSQRLSFMDEQFLARPRINHPGGLVEPGFAVVLLPSPAPGSSVIFTRDGSDPRLPGGGVSPLAQATFSPVVVNVSSNICLVARSYNPAHRNLTGAGNPPLSSPWSGPITAPFYTQTPPLRITEIMYHPAASPGFGYEDEDYEFLEVKNTGAHPLSLHGFTLRGDISFDFPDETLGPGECAAIVAHADAFALRYPWQPRVLGAFTNRLPNDAGRLVLSGPMREAILDFSYSDEWYPITDSIGFSLVHNNPAAPPDDWNAKWSWRPSALPGAFPGADDPSPTETPQVVINEVWTYEDAIEILNLSPDPADIGGWFLTDDFRDPKKYQIPSRTILPPGGLLMFDAATLGFSISASGEEVYLFSANEGTLTGYYHGFDFGALETDLSFGRYLTESGNEQFPIQRIPTPSTSNVGPRIGPVVISEIHYRPPDHVFASGVFDNDEEEFIELLNISAETVLLSQEGLSNSWRLTDAVLFEFSSDASIQPGGLALVVGFDPADQALLQAFRNRYQVPEHVPIYGPFEGKLDNSADRVELRRPIPPDPVYSDPEPYSLVERVTYSDDPPWPSASDGLARSLHRLDPESYGNEPRNWIALPPTPGRLQEPGSAPPLITAQPGDATAAAGAGTTFIVQVESSSPAEYQWRFNGQPVPDATNSTLRLENLQPSNAGTYDVVVMNDRTSVNSRKATLRLLMPPQIAQQPGMQLVETNATAHFSVLASSDAPLTYQWCRNGIPLPGETEPVLKISNVQESDQAIYNVLLDNGVQRILSEDAPLAISAAPSVLFPGSPLQVYASPGQVLTLSTEIYGTFPLWLRWRVVRPGVAQTLSTEILGPPGPLPLVLTQAASFLTIEVQDNSSGAYVMLLTNLASTTQTVITNLILTVVQDSDEDLLPDDYESSLGLDPWNASDSGEDLDGDGVSNQEEYLSGTDPRDPASLLRIESIGWGPTEDVATPGVTLQFEAAPNHSYTLQYKDPITEGEWMTLTNVPARTTNRIQRISDRVVSTNRYYRLGTPVIR